MLDSPAAPSFEADEVCLAKADEHGVLLVRCLAAARLSDRGIRLWMRHYLDQTEPEPDEAAWLFAHHCGAARVPARQIVAWLCEVAVKVPYWLDDPDRIAELAEAAAGEDVA